MPESPAPDGNSVGVHILFLGDVVGKAGRRAVGRWLPDLRAGRPIDLVVANGENTAGGLGATPKMLEELRGYGVDAFTMGNHVWKHKEMVAGMDGLRDVVRPANYPEGAPGRGATLVSTPGGHRLGLINLLGRVYIDRKSVV